MTNAELAILSLIHEQPRHGYEIEQVIEERGMRDWTEIGFSSIYYLLKKLEKAGLVEGRIAEPSSRGPARKVYHITPAGREAVLEGTLATLSTPENCYRGLQLGLANLPGLPVEQALDALRSYLQGLEDRYAYVQERAEAQHPLPPHVEAMFSHSLTMIKAEMDWIEVFINELSGNR